MVTAVAECTAVDINKQRHGIDVHFCIGLVPLQDTDDCPQTRLRTYRFTSSKQDSFGRERGEKVCC